MSAELHPGILALDTESLCYSLYSELYNQFFNAQDKKSESFPYGIEEGDDTSIRLRNTAYGFAVAIAGAVNGEGAGGGILLDYLMKAGGDMTGPLRANYGFEAGIGNTRVLETYTYKDGEKDIYGVRIHGELDVGSTGIIAAGTQILSYDQSTHTTVIHTPRFDFGASSVVSSGEIIVGGRESGVYISPDALLFRGKHVYHEGNANLETVDWRMKDARVDGSLEVVGSVVLSGYLSALYGAELGTLGNVLLSLGPDSIDATCHLSFGPNYGIKISGSTVLGRIGEKDVQIGGIGGDLLLGSVETNKIVLKAGVMDADAEYMLISPYGAAYFPDSLTVRHNYGDTLLSSYRTDSNDEGVVIHKILRFGSTKGPSLYHERDGIAFCSFVEYTDPESATKSQVFYDTVMRYGPSTSRYALPGQKSDSLIIETGADTIRINKPVEGENYIGIEGSLTRITANGLFFSEEIYLHKSTDGIKHFGNAYFLGSIGSELFSSGFAGSGWAIQKNETTGNTMATFDELTVRKRMRIYELEVQKISATNGSLWISDSFSGDSVEQIH